MSKLFQRNPRNVRIASWVAALGLFAAWYKYDQMQQRRFSDKETQAWNEAILRQYPAKPRQKKSPENANKNTK